MFWDAQSNIDTDMEDEMFWDAMTNVNGDADDQTEQGTNEAVIIQPAPSNMFSEIWNELNNIEFIDIQSELEKSNNWTVTSDNETIKEIDTEKEKAESNSNVINGISKSQRRPNAVLYDDDDSSSRKSEKPKHGKDDKYETKKEK